MPNSYRLYSNLAVAIPAHNDYQNAMQEEPACFDEPIKRDLSSRSATDSKEESIEDCSLDLDRPLPPLPVTSSKRPSHYLPIRRWASGSIYWVRDYISYLVVPGKATTRQPSLADLPPRPRYFPGGRCELPTLSAGVKYLGGKLGYRSFRGHRDCKSISLPSVVTVGSVRSPRRFPSISTPGRESFYSVDSRADLDHPADHRSTHHGGVEGSTTLDDGRALYRLCKIAGSGGFATVYIAEVMPYDVACDANWPAHVAIKVFNRQSFIDNDLDTAHIELELAALQRATKSRSPFLTPVISTFYDKYNCYAVMPLYAEDLATRLYSARPRVTAAEIRLYAAELLVAIEDFHDLRLVHHDIKCENVFITPNGHVVLGDYSTASPVGRGATTLENWQNSTIERTSSPVGTAPHFAPEQWDDRYAYTHKVDLWGYGLVLFGLFKRSPEALFCERPGDVVPGSQDIETKDIAAEVDMWVDDPEAADLIKSLLRLDPDDRPLIDEVKRHAYFASGHEWDIENYWSSIRNGKTKPLYRPEQHTELKDFREFFHTAPYVKGDEEDGFDTTHPAYRYECPEELMQMDKTIYGQWQKPLQTTGMSTDYF